MCDKVQHEIEIRKKVNEGIDDCSSESDSQITVNKVLQVGGYGYGKSAQNWPPSLSNWCPRASMYYTWTEDTNPFDRIEEFIKAERNNAETQIHQIHFDPPLDPFTTRDPYEENAARAKYLDTEPVSFAIFGKPGLDNHKLAKLVADWWKCVLVSPESLISDEIENNTDKGWWITEMLKKGETLGPDIIMNLINSRIKKRDVMHRGYVVEGVPFIPEDAEIESSTCPEDIPCEQGKGTCYAIGPCLPESETTTSTTCSTDSFVSLPLKFNRRGDYELDVRINMLHRTTIQESLREVKNLASTNVRVNPFTLENDAEELPEKCKDYISQQINSIFQSWPVKPTVIIYVACPDEDLDGCLENREFDPVVDTNNRKRQDTAEGQFDDEMLEKKLIERTSLVATLQAQCQIYKRYALPVIERYVLLHNPQNVIRVEGRTSLSQIFEVVTAKLRSLPFSRAIIPQRIWEDDEMFEDEEEQESENEKAQISNDRMNEAFDRLAKKSTVSSKFRWSISNWKFMCPVEMAMGRKVEGRVDCAVRFMNKIFFLSSLERLERFLENPRPFLLSMEPRPICRIAIFGPRYSGKSELSESLARKYLANVIDVREMVREITDERRDANIAEAMRETCDRVVNDLRTRLENEREEREIARKNALDSWFHEAREIIQRFDELRETDLSGEEEDFQEDSDTRFLRNKLQEHGLQAFKENHELLETAGNNEMIIYDYAPHNLRDVEPPVRELSEHDPEVAAVLENEVKHLRDDKIVITNSEIAEFLISRISMIADEQIDGKLSREPGCIIDGMYPDPEIWKILIEAGVIFDDLILITEEPPYENLLRSWKRYYDAKNSSGESEFHDQYVEDFEKMEKYIEDLKDFENKWKLFSATLEENEIVPFICKFDETTNIYETVLNHISAPYRFEAKVVSGEDRDRELEDTSDSATDTDKGSEEDFSQDEQLEESESERMLEDNRSFGDTGIYCPVALARANVLWKGKDQYSASFLDKMYLFSSAEALTDFVKSPETFNVPFKKPITEGPFARICIVGPPASGKSTLAKILSAEYGMIHVDFSNRLNKFVNDPPDAHKKDRLGHNDNETVLEIVQKYEEEGAALPERILDECIFNFFKKPHTNSAIIFDSFPNCLEDAQVMINNYAVPEVVIELECSLDKAQERLLPELLEAFMKKQEIGKNIDDEEKDVEEEEDEEEEKDKEEKDEENSDEQEAKDRILREMEEVHERKNEMLDKVRTRMEEESIPWIIINTDKDLDNLKQNLRKIIRPFIHRESPPLERTYQLNPYKADDLLECGYYLLSSFGRSCPVQIYDRNNPFQMYLPMDERDEIYPILHRHYIYFVAGEEASKRFQRDPLRYVSQDSCNVVIPAKISIVGPPKCGKTTLAERFARAYGLRVINREEALTRIRKNYSWTKTAIEIEQLLQSNKKITKKLFARVVELYSSDYRSCTQGYILDGFPSDREETEELTLLNIRPMVVINLRADRGFCLESITNDEAISRKIIEQSVTEISRRYDKWQEQSSRFLEWLKKFTQIIVDVNGTGSKWAVWRESDRRIRSRFDDIKRYFREADYDKVHSLKSLAVTPYEFKNRQSSFEAYCPACLSYEETLTFSGSPPDRCGVVQFREYFYWICPRHYEGFAKNPLACLPPQSTAGLPKIRPQVLNDEVDIEHACWARRLVADGICIVTYADSLPRYEIVPGKRNIAVLYEDRLFLFCSLACREKFLSRAPMYSKIVIKISEITEIMTKNLVKNLTNLEYLEKTLAEDIIKSVTEAAAKRPKYPGMSPAISAAVYIGVCLKIHNLQCEIDEIEVYKEVANRMDARSQIIQIAMQNMKKNIHPYDDLSV